MPSDSILALKQQQVSELAAELKSAATLVVADYRGLTVSEDTELRNELRKQAVTYRVVKNSILRRAAEEAGLKDMDELFVGPSAIAYSAEDPVSPAKVLKQFADKHDQLEIRGGAMDGARVDLKRIQQLASIPAVEVLYGQVVGGLISPIAGLAMILAAVEKKMNEQGLENVVDAVEERATTEEATAEAEEPAAESTEA